MQARDNLPALDGPKLQQFQQIIDMENPDLYKWLTGQADVPSDVDNPLLRQLCNDLRGSMEPKVTVQTKGGFEGKVWE